ncbi:serine hydrolase [Candidatus Peregrinibacteria bacterium]|nr:serine hydrolase [Candidatus Peregrinibacteria bacterium]
MKTIINFILIVCMMAQQLHSQDQKEKVKGQILHSFEKKVKKDKSLGTGILLVHSDLLDIHWKTAVNNSPVANVYPDQPFHFASIGKTVTSVMIGILYEKGLIDYEDLVADHLDQSIVNGLHVYKGIDYSKQIKIRQLLNHTSGLGDYYTDKNNEGISLMDMMLSSPEKFWTPIETIMWTKKNLKSKFKPGKGFHYSDTNYQLLGLIIEQITGMALHDAFKTYIFEPLDMNNSYMILHSGPIEKCKYPMVDFYHNDLNLIEAKSISMSWASGGIVSTTEDMLKFHEALVRYKIIKESTFKKMCDWAKMGPGFFYGYGLMNFRFIMTPKKYDIWGNSGSIGAFMYYNPHFDTYIIGSFHKMGYESQPIFFILKTLKKLKKINS